MVDGSYEDSLVFHLFNSMSHASSVTLFRTQYVASYLQLHSLSFNAPMIPLFGIVPLLVVADFANAFNAYKPDCPAPPEHINYASSPPVRGTLDIIWACLAVVLTCTWAVQHLSVPVHVSFQKPSWIPPRVAGIIKEPLLRDIAFFTSKFKWMLISIAAPEFILGKALAERWAAQESR